jgi:hypothetical protein
MHVCTYARIRICTPPRTHMDEHLTQQGMQKLHKEHRPDKVHCKRQIQAVIALQVMCGRANACSVDEEFQHDVHALHIASSLADRGQHAQIRLDVADGGIGLIRGLHDALACILNLGGSGRRRAVSASAPMHACTRVLSTRLGLHTRITHTRRTATPMHPCARACSRSRHAPRPRMRVPVRRPDLRQQMTTLNFIRMSFSMIASAKPPAPTTTAQGARSGHSSTIAAHHHPVAARQQARMGPGGNLRQVLSRVVRPRGAKRRSCCTN